MRHRAILGLLVAAAAASAPAGDLNPPGAPAPTMATLEEINDNVVAIQNERIPVDTLAGDGDSMHVITFPGSYYLRGNIVAPANFDGIECSVDGVTIDLNGHQIIGGGSGAVHGVNIGTGTRSNIAIKNGSIHDFGGSGIGSGGATVSALRLNDLQLFSNAGSGVDAPGSGARVTNCVARNNFVNGYNLGFGASVTDCVAANNGSFGFLVDGGTLSNCSANGHFVGFSLSLATVSNCQAFQNTDGFVAFRSNLSGCSAVQNVNIGFDFSTGNVATNCSANGNASHGFRTNTDGLFTNCLSEGNGTGGTGAGFIVTGSRNRFDSNNTVNNDFGFLVGNTGNVFVRNTASGNTSNYSIPAGNTDAAVATPGATFTGVDPWANFSY